MPIHPPRNNVSKHNTFKHNKTTEEKMIERLFEMLDNWLTMKDPHKNDLHYLDYSCCHPILEINNDMKRLMIAAVKECNAEMVNIIQETLDARYVQLEIELSGEKMHLH